MCNRMTSFSALTTSPVVFISFCVNRFRCPVFWVKSHRLVLAFYYFERILISVECCACVFFNGKRRVEDGSKPTEIILKLAKFILKRTYFHHFCRSFFPNTRSMHSSLFFYFLSFFFFFLRLYENNRNRWSHFILLRIKQNLYEVQWTSSIHQCGIPCILTFEIC